MKEIDDEELQRMMEQQFGNVSQGENFRPETEDEQLYQALFTALAQEPPTARTPLADNVVAIIEQEQHAEAWKFNAIITTAAAASLIAVFIALAVVSPSLLHTLTGLASHYLSVIVFVVAALAGIQYLDKKLVKARMAV